jgi:hypothetical protein
LCAGVPGAAPTRDRAAPPAHLRALGARHLPRPAAPGVDRRPFHLAAQRLLGDAQIADQRREALPARRGEHDRFSADRRRGRRGRLRCPYSGVKPTRRCADAPPPTGGAARPHFPGDQRPILGTTPGETVSKR